MIEMRRLFARCGFGAVVAGILVGLLNLMPAEAAPGPSMTVKVTTDRTACKVAATVSWRNTGTPTQITVWMNAGTVENPSATIATAYITTGLTAGSGSVTTPAYPGVDGQKYFAIATYQGSTAPPQATSRAVTLRCR